MAITFEKQVSRQRYLIFVFIIVILITAFLIWRNYFYQEIKIEEEIILKPAKKIEINFGVLDNPLLKELQPIDKIPSLEAGVELGRKTPFTPY